MTIAYRSFADLAGDVRVWSRQLPSDIDLVVGIPRSGMLPAALLALERQVPLTDIDGFHTGRIMAAGARLSIDPTVVPRRVLVVDDSVLAGSAMRGAREMLAGHPLADRLLWGAVYMSPYAPDGIVDVSYAVVGLPRVFEWNVLHHELVERFCVDIDGVLCRDPGEAENDDGVEYERFLTGVAAQVIPSGEVGWVVTSRLERYRKQTEEWLVRAGIRYRELVMHPAATAHERRAAADHAIRKADFYRGVPALLFVESDPGQARVIADRSKKPVYCFETSMMVYPGRPMSHGADPGFRNRLRWQRSRLIARVRAGLALHTRARRLSRTRLGMVLWTDREQ